MGISPWAQGDGKPIWTFALEPDSGTFDTSGLSTSDFTLTMLNISNQQITVATGPFSNLTAASGGNPAQISFQPSSNDVAALGMFEIDVVLKRGITGQQRTFEFGIWSNEP